MAMTLDQLATLSAAELQAAVQEGSANIGDVITEMNRRTAEAEKAAEKAAQERDAAKAAAKASNGRTIKVNSSGGLYVRDPSFKCWSHDKSKEYVGGVNLDPDLARALFSNADLCKAIAEYLSATGLTKHPKKSAAAPVTAQPADNGNTGQAAAAALVSTAAPLAGRTRK